MRESHTRRSPSGISIRAPRPRDAEAAAGRRLHPPRHAPGYGRREERHHGPDGNRVRVAPVRVVEVRPHDRDLRPGQQHPARDQHRRAPPAGRPPADGGDDEHGPDRGRRHRGRPGRKRAVGLTRGAPVRRQPVPVGPAHRQRHRHEQPEDPGRPGGRTPRGPAPRRPRLP
ncbi:hypothetical protein SSAG_02127 [Streptomyces sp. Mg1]|nr:hypothetical protein SSAG_02127 [Streptomyces sp. Mg1]